MHQEESDKLKSNQAKFIFSFDFASEAEKDVDLRISAIEDAIQGVIRACEINTKNGPWPIIESILQVTSNKDELERLGKGLSKIAPLVTQIEDLRRKKSIISIAREDSNWLMSTFGDYTDEIDSLTDSILKEK